MKKETVSERFLRYVSVDTQSDENSNTFPSTEKQKNLGRMLYEELKAMGASDAVFDENYGYVYAKIPGRAGEKTLGFIAHMDTSPDASGTDIKARVVENYDGGDILLNPERNIVMSPKTYPEMLAYKGQSLIVTDGTTLLGADDKAGVAEIMAMAAWLLSHPEEEHAPIAIAFTPDEEVGGGVDHFDLKQFGADFAYTVDGGGIGELEYENFNAASAKAVIHGINVHPGDAKDKMKNASLIAMEFNAMLPADQRPDCTEGYEGFFHLTEMKGEVEHAELSYIIRDHDALKFAEKKKTIQDAADAINAKYGENTIELAVADSYYNMKSQIAPDYLFLIDEACEAMKELGVEPKVQPIRGGTDGARLSFMGLPCPNLCTGGHNYHGRFEYCCIESMESIEKLLVKLTSNRHE